MLNFDLEWFAIKRPTRSAQMFVHVLKDGQMVTQRDGMPDETYPTDAWPPGTTVTTHWEIPGVETPVTIQFGLYDVFSDQRWTITAHDGLSAVDNYVEMACPAP